MKRKGFTLIELLAVIIILAIIALITTPIVLNIIKDSKKESTRLSVENYLRAVRVAFMDSELSNNPILNTGDYKITENGKVLVKDDNTKINITFDGPGLEEGTLKIEDGKVKKIIKGKIDNWYAKLVLGRVVLLDKLSESVILSGANFNAKIKTLANDTAIAYNKEDTVVTTIQFLSDGDLPEGYTQEKLRKLKSVDVSDKQDGTILALYDTKGTVYVYSEDEIILNKVSGDMFRQFKSLKEIKSLSTIDTSQVTTMEGMFRNCSSLTKLDLSNFDTSNVTNMQYMFIDCSNLTNLDLSSFNTSKVFYMQYMFYNCSSLTSLNLSNFNTSKVTDMSDMFLGCRSLTNLDLSSFDTSKVTSMYSMFSGCRSLTSLNLSNFNTSKVSKMVYMFRNCSSLSSLDISNFDTSNLTSMSDMFENCSSLTSLDLSNFDTSKVTDMDGMFSGCSSLTNLNVSKFDTTKVTDMGSMFRNCINLTNLDLSNFDTFKVTNMQDMFSYCSNLELIKVGSKWTTENVTFKSGMFSGCKTQSVTVVSE